MKFLKVVNKGTVHRKLLELIGFSTKRDELDNLAIIGSKGSGAKLLVPAALRLGLQVFVCSSDEEGPYVLKYGTKKIKIGQREVQQVYFVYGKDTAIPAQLVLESFSDWDKPIGSDNVKEFKIIREILINARDADPEFCWDIVESEEPGYSYKSEETTVFVSLTEGVAEIIRNNPERYFKFLGAEPLHSVSAVGGIYSKSSPVTRIFILGVLAECKLGDIFDVSLLDYSIDDKNLLSEERTITNETELRKKIGTLLTSTGSVSFAKELIRGILAGKAYYENSCLSYLPQDFPDERLENFRVAWAEMEEFGEKAIVSDTASLSIEEAKLLNEDAKYHGYNVINIVCGGLRQLLCKAGIKKVTDVATRRMAQDTITRVTPTDEENETLEQALSILKYYFPTAENFPVGAFVTNDPKAKWDGLAGTGETRFKEMLVNRNAFSKGVAYVLEILVHEFRHCISEATDCTIEFEKQADRDQVVIMFKALENSQE